MVTVALLAAVLAASQTAWAAPLTVNKVADSGAGSLRQAITDANASGGSDTISFAPGMSGKTVTPLSPLPDLGPGITINGDINNDGAPDVRLRGTSAGTGSGLNIIGSGCHIYGLAIMEFPHYGIRATSVTDTIIQKCHLGVNLPGTGAAYNHSGQLMLIDCDGSIVGGAGSLRNIIAGGEDNFEAGVSLVGTGDNNVIAGNYIGLKRDGSGPLGAGDRGIYASITPSAPGVYNYIGATGPGLANVLGGLNTGLYPSGSQRLLIRNNFFGLTGDGNSIAPISYASIYVTGGSNNTIGGSSPAARNVFAGPGTGISFQSAAPGYRVLGNWFGTNGSGTARRQLRYGISLTGSASPVQIGGVTPQTGNYFTPYDPGHTLVGVYIVAGSGTVVRNNHFGVLPNGKGVPVAGSGVSVQTRVYVRDNEFANCQCGIYNIGAGADGRVFGNLFRNCYIGVQMYDGRLLLGNLANPSTADDGGNDFRLTNTYHIWNSSPINVRAEGNNFHTTLKANINAKIRDRKDDPTLGVVDYTPLAGGIIPSGETEGQLAVSGLSAVPTVAGAEIAFTLSAPAEVSVDVLNLAGRPVATPAISEALPPGLNRLTWSGRSVSGLSAPAGRYLVRISARTESGAETTALAPLVLQR